MANIPNTVILRRPGLEGTEEKVAIKNIIWASPYTTRSGIQGILLLLNSCEFRFFVNKFAELQMHYELYIGRMWKAGKKILPLWDGQ